MRAVLTQIRAAVLRRRAQTATVLLISLLAGSVSTMALTLLVRSTAPWDDAFAHYQGAHLIFHFDASRVTAEQLQATASLPGVIAAGAPRQTVEVPFARKDQKGVIRLIGRDDPSGRVDRLPIVAGRWPHASGEIAVTRTGDSSIPIRPRLGETILALTNRGTVQFKVVGEVTDFGGHGDEVDFSSGVPGAWVLPDEIARLADGEQSRLGYEMAYRFQHAANTGELDADRKLIENALPTGAETSPVADWQLMRAGSIWFVTLMSSLIASFTVFALIAVTVIVASVVAGSVLSGYRDIGVTKALGFTPIQVVGVHIGQMLVPAVVGALLGVPLGTAASDPFLNNSAIALQLPQGRAFDPVVAAAVPAALALLVVVAALVPGLRAAATDSARAMVLGSAPSPGRRSLLSTALVRLRAPRPLSLGAGDAFARPVRGLLTLTVLVIGIATATFAIGLQDRFSTVLRTEAASYGYGQDVVVHRYPGLADNTLSAQLAQQPETRRVLGVETLTIRVSGLKDSIPIYALRGEAGAFGYRAQRGRWLVGPGEAVVSPAFANGAHLGVGDSFSGTLIGGPPLTLRVVGMQNDFNSVGGSIRISWATLTALLPGAVPDQYQVKLAPGSDAKAYAQRVGALYPDSVTAVATQIADVDVVTNLITGSVGFLALVLLAIAAAGVFNATLLTTRERVREISVLKTVGMTSRQIAMMAVGSTLVLLVLASGVGVPFGIWLEGVIWNSMLSIFDVLVLPGPSLAALPLALALVAAFVFALLGAALPARWAAATPVAQVLRSE